MEVRGDARRCAAAVSLGSARRANTAALSHHLADVSRQRHIFLSPAARRGRRNLVRGAGVGRGCNQRLAGIMLSAAPHLRPFPPRLGVLGTVFRT